MIDYFKVVTITHHVIDVAEIEDYLVKADGAVQIEHKLELIKERMDISELCYLSTCNRVSYMFYTEKEVDLGFITTFFDHINPNLHLQDSAKLSSLVSVYEGMEAIQNIFEVACSVDSMVVGEREIYRQFRDALEFSRIHKLTGDNFRLIDRAAVEAAKKVYSSTRIGEKPISIAALAMDSLMENNPSKGSNIVFIGAGETNQLMAKFFLKHQFVNFKVFNRTLSKAKELAQNLNGKAYDLDQLAENANDFDILVVCTASTQAIISADLFSKMMHNNSGKKTIIDLSVPSNLDKSIFEKFTFDHIKIDDLKSLAEKNMEFRKQEITLAKTVIHQQLPIFRNVYQQRQLERALADLPTEIKLVKKKAMEEVFLARLSQLDENSKQLITDMMDYFEKKSISIPMKTAKKAFELDVH